MRPVTKSRLYRALRFPVGMYVLLCLLVGVFQRRIIYFPFYKTEVGMLAEAQRLGCQPWRDKPGAIIGWKSSRPGMKAANRLIVFHGNAGYALNRIHYLQAFQQMDAGRLWEVYLFEYPGFGARPGSLGYESFLQAGSQAIQTLQAEDSRPIYVAGESLGSGLASALAQQEGSKIAGVLLVTPFARLEDVAALRFWYLPVRSMLRDRWDNISTLREYSGPLAVILAGQDEIVSTAQGQLLYDGYQARKQRWVEPQATHNGLDFSLHASWWREASDFLLDGTRPRLSAP